MSETLAENLRKIAIQISVDNKSKLIKKAEADLPRLLKGALKKINKATNKGYRYTSYTGCWFTDWNCESKMLLVKELKSLGFEARDSNYTFAIGIWW